MAGADLLPLAKYRDRFRPVVRNRSYAGGVGLPTIAHTLNQEGASCPRAQQGRVNGWCPSSVRAILTRSLYRGQIIHGRVRKRGLDGSIQPTVRPESEWLRVAVPNLRIVPPEIAEAVDARFASQRTRALRLNDGRLIGRPPGEGSPYLLTGLLRCGVCGGGMEVLSKKGVRGQRVFEYRCYVARRKGAAVCSNNLPASMADTDAAVLREVETTLLNPRVVERALAHAESLIFADRTVEQRAALETQVAETAAAIRRLTTAIAQGGELAPLVAALDTHERQRKDLDARLCALSVPRHTIDADEVRRTLGSYLADWQKLLRGHVHQAQQIVRRLVKDRLTMLPQADGYYMFSGKGTVRPLLSGAIRNLASPPGSATACNPVLQRLQRRLIVIDLIERPTED